jgi:hypothetical protein
MIRGGVSDKEGGKQQQQQLQQQQQGWLGVSVDRGAMLVSMVWHNDSKTAATTAGKAAVQLDWQEDREGFTERCANAQASLGPTAWQQQQQ